MRLAKRYSLTLALVMLMMPLALLVALVMPARPVAPAALSAPRPFTVEVPERCPVYIGYARVAVTRDPALYRYTDQNADGVVCVRFPRSRIPAAVLIDGRGSGGPNPCPAHFILTTPEHVPIPDLAG